jgi:heat shock protein HslJ
MKPALILGILLVVAAICVAGCTQPLQPATQPANVAPAEAPATAATQAAVADNRLLAANPWVLDTMFSKGTQENLVSGTLVTARFNPDGIMNGNAGCNDYFAPYVVSGKSLKIGEVGSTLKACGEPGIMDQETTYLAVLQTTSTYTVSTDNSLLLSDAEGKNKLTFTVFTPEALTGTWMLDSIANGSTVSTLVKGTSITALFAKDGNLTGSAGCNDYFATYKTTGDALSLTPIGTTRKFCAEPAGVMDQEILYISQLQNTTSFTIKDNILTMMDAKRKGLLFYKQAN